MAKSKSCKPTLICIKKKSGKKVCFHGRKGGAELCGKKRPSVVQREFRSAFRSIAKVCNKAGRKRSLRERVALRRACWKNKTRSYQPATYALKSRRSLR